VAALQPPQHWQGHPGRHHGRLCPGRHLQGVDTPAKPRGVQIATGIAPYPDQQGRGTRIPSRRLLGLQCRPGPGGGQKVLHGVLADVTCQVHVHCWPKDPRHGPEVPLLRQPPSSRRRPKSGGRPPTSALRRRTTRRRFSKSPRRRAKSCRRPPLVFTTGPRLYKGTRLRVGGATRQHDRPQAHGDDGQGRESRTRVNKTSLLKETKLKGHDKARA
jgi:hypothetical protein